MYTCTYVCVYIYMNACIHMHTYVYMCARVKYVYIRCVTPVQQRPHIRCSWNYLNFTERFIQL